MRLNWVFIDLRKGMHNSLGFWILCCGFQIPDSNRYSLVGFRIPSSVFPGAPNGSVPQNICSSGEFLLAGCWDIVNSGCLRGFDV